ncbi:MAG TPA: hypothetical protein VNV41_06285 [Candidatus Acidoferrales bacterium]|nr:hypothetical protein [Candidatus Acidoferrales bacterium]
MADGSTDGVYQKYVASTRGGPDFPKITCVAITISIFLRHQSPNYLGQPTIGDLPAKIAARYVSLYWGGVLIGRFIGAGVLRKIRTGTVLDHVGIQHAFILPPLCYLYILYYALRGSRPDAGTHT